MKVTVVTVCYNSRETIAECIQSVISQEYVDVEYIIVDGQSSDGTVQIIEKSAREQKSKIRFISEKDNGIYDAMNKGIRMASGDVVGFLNADDFFADNSVIGNLIDSFKSGAVDIVYGDIDIIYDREDRKVIRSWKSGKYNHRALKFGWHPPHPAFYMRRGLFESLGGFDLAVGLSADYDLMIRALMASGNRVAYLNQVLVKMRHGGASTSGLRPVLRGWVTCQLPWQKISRPYAGLMAATLKPLRKIFQVRL
jgi:glycosyltransferase involved in cell wall biosynthesis